MPAKTMPAYEIIEFHKDRNAEVVALILAVQRNDVGLYVPIEEQPELYDIGLAYSDGGFWLAVADDEIVGTVGVQPYGSNGILKKLFVRSDFRGQGGAAHALHDTAVEWSRARGLDAIFLDTPSVATRSHAFYERKGYRLAARSELPEGYTFPDRDSLIFKLDIAAI